MKREVYHIKGFDCANCAVKSEKHLNKDKRIQNASIDFAGERMFITYVDAPMSIDELKKCIKEVESDDVEITKYGVNSRQKSRIFTREFFIKSIRIALALAIGLFTRFYFGEDSTHWVAILLYSISLAIVLYDLVWKVIYNIVHLTNPIDEYFLIVVASIGAYLMVLFGEPEFFEGLMVVCLWQVGQLFEEIATKKSKDAISNAIDLRADIANLINEDRIVTVKPEELKVGDKILVRVGEIVPVDGKIVDGNGSLDMSSLTGEPVPVTTSIGQNVLSGSILITGSITIEVEKIFADSSISKILELVQSSGERKTKTEKFITKFARIYTPLVITIGVVFALIYGLVTSNWSDGVYRGLEVLLIGCPCAIVISVPLAYFASIGLASKKGILVKGGNFLDALTKIGTLFLDKTGTLTYGNFVVKKICPINIKEEEFKKYLLAAESRSNHPIAKAICAHENVSELALYQEEYEELAGLGVKTKYENHQIYAGNAALMEKIGVKFEEIFNEGTIVYLVVDNKYVGYISIDDTIREKAKTLVQKMDSLNVNVILLSGDTKDNVARVANEVGIKEWHYKLLPQDKTVFVEKEIEEKRKNKDKKLVAFAGDGINDTPSIIRADVGIAMGGIGSDVAVENADVVIMQDHPLKIYSAIKIGKIARFITIFNIIVAILIKAAVMVLSLVGILDNMIFAVLADTGLTLILIINSLLILTRKIKD